jgi:hypothetical protein
MMETRQSIRENDIPSLRYDLPRDELIYLASPYSHPDPEIRRWRYDAACYATAKMIIMGYKIFSPIINNHPLVRYGVATEWEAWIDYDKKMLELCKGGLIVLMLDGWNQSAGVAGEVMIARDLNYPVQYLSQWFKQVSDPAPSPTDPESSSPDPTDVACEEHRCCDTSEEHDDSPRSGEDSTLSQHQGE